MPIDPKQLESTMASLMNVTKVFQSTMEGLLSSMDKLAGKLDDSIDKMDDMGEHAKDVVNQTDKMRGSITDVSKVLKQMSLSDTLFDPDNLKQTERLLVAVRGGVEKLKRESNFGPAGTIALLGVLEKLEGVLKKVGAQMHRGGAFDAAATREAQQAIIGISGTVEALTQKFQKMRSPLSSIGKTFRETFGHLGNFGGVITTFEKHARLKERAELSRQQAAENRISNSAIFRKKAAGHGRMGELLSGIELNDEGKVDLGSIRRMQQDEGHKERARELLSMDKGDLQEMAMKLSGRKGKLGRIEAVHAANKMRSMAEAVASEGEISEAAVAGIGHIAGGGGSYATGAAESAVSGAGGGSLAGPIAGVVLAITLLKEAFDGMANSNRDIFSKVGTGGGLLGGGGNVFSAFQNVRENLTPGINLYGQTREGNLAIAETITKFGVSVGELSRAGNDLNKNIIGKAGAKAGTGLASTIFGGARMLGLDAPAATEQIMKVLLQYHKSLQSTDAFFNQLISDTEAAGLTTTKYIQILDEITGQFGTMAKGVDDVTSSLRMLGQTGLLSSDQVQDAMKALMVQKNDTAMNAFLLQGAPKELLTGAKSSWQATTNNQAKNVREALSSTYEAFGMNKEDMNRDLVARGVDIDSLGEGGAKGRAASNALENAIGAIFAGKTGDSNAQLKKQNLGVSLGQLTANQKQLDALTEFVNNPNSPKAALNLASMANKGPAFGALINAAGIPNMLMKAGIAGNADEAWKVMLGGGGSDKNLQVDQFLQSIGKTPEDIENLREPLRLAAGAEVAGAKAGTISSDAYRDIAKYLPNDALKEGATPKDIQAALSNDKTFNLTMEKMATSLSALNEFTQPNSPFVKSLSDSAQKQGDAQAEKAKQLGEAMTRTGDILQQISEFLQTHIYGALTAIAKPLGYKTPEELAQDRTNTSHDDALNGPYGRYLGKLEDNNYTSAHEQLENAHVTSTAMEKYRDSISDKLSKIDEKDPKNKKLVDDYQDQIQKINKGLATFTPVYASAKSLQAQYESGDTGDKGEALTKAFENLSYLQNDKNSDINKLYNFGVLAPGYAALSSFAPKGSNDSGKSSAPITVIHNETTNISGTALSVTHDAKSVGVSTESSPTYTGAAVTKQSQAAHDAAMKIASSRQ